MALVKQYDGRKALIDIVEDSPFKPFDTIEITFRLAELGAIVRRPEPRDVTPLSAQLAVREWLLGAEPEGGREEAAPRGEARGVTEAGRRAAEAYAAEEAKRADAPSPADDILNDTIQTPMVEPEVLHAPATAAIVTPEEAAPREEIHDAPTLPRESKKGPTAKNKKRKSARETVPATPAAQAHKSATPPAQTHKSATPAAQTHKSATPPAQDVVQTHNKNVQPHHGGAQSPAAKSDKQAAKPEQHAAKPEQHAAKPEQQAASPSRRGQAAEDERLAKERRRAAPIARREHDRAVEEHPAGADAGRARRARAGGGQAVAASGGARAHQGAGLRSARGRLLRARSRSGYGASKSRPSTTSTSASPSLPKRSWFTSQEVARARSATSSAGQIDEPTGLAKRRISRLRSRWRESASRARADVEAEPQLAENSPRTGKNSQLVAVAELVGDGPAPTPPRAPARPAASPATRLVDRSRSFQSQLALGRLDVELERLAPRDCSCRSSVRLVLETIL